MKRGQKKTEDYKPNYVLWGLKTMFPILFMISIAIDILVILNMIDSMWLILSINVLLICYAFIVVTTVYMDARSINAGNAYPEGKVLSYRTWRPLIWAILVFFLCFPFFAFYLWKRRKIYMANNK
jgi:hypothetical protein